MSEQLWWQAGVIYQVYPRSFQATPGAGVAGVGDLRGITARLAYLAELGIAAVWMSPFYPSPMADFGYDVADYTGVDALFGTMADFDALLAEAHRLGLRVILDFVPNHSSDEHPWFLDSRSSRTSAKRDWYLWRDPAPDGGLPNNWLSNFGGSGWTFDHATAQYYYHSFLPQQPDLNWRNPAVREAIYNAMRFWLAKGVDGFRMDVLWLLIKDDQFRPNLPNPDYHGAPGDSEFWSVLPTYTADQPETQEIVRAMRAVVDSFSGDRVLIGEIYLPVPELVRYYGAAAEQDRLDGAQMPFNFHLIQTPWQASAIAALIRDYEAALPAGAWPNWVLGNHDQHRLATRLGVAQARVAAVLLLTLRGTPTMYYGDELGMPDAAVAADQVVDPAELRQPGRGFGRDPERSPMLWDAGANAGFCAMDETPWLPLVANWQTLTVEHETNDEASTLTLYRNLLKLRNSMPALHAGGVEDVLAEGSVLRYTRSADGIRLLVLLNLSGAPATVFAAAGAILLSSYGDTPERAAPDNITLRPAEAVIVHLS